jgi:hypothetical protein
MERRPIVALVISIVLLTLSSHEAHAQFYELTPSSDDILINNDTIINFSASPYNIDDANQNGVLVINAPDITLDCDGSSFIGDESSGSTAILIDNHDNVTITNCLIQGYDYGIYATGDELNISYNNISYGIYDAIRINDSSSGYVINNTIMAPDSNHIGLQLGNCIDYLIENNVIEGPGLWGILIIDSSDISMQDNSISIVASGIAFSETRNVTFNSGSVFNNLIDLQLENAWDTFLNDLNYVNLTRIWYVRVNVTDSDSSPIQGAVIRILNHDSTEEWPNPVTLADGLTVKLALKAYVENSSGTHYKTPHTFNLSKDGFENGSIIVNITDTMIINISLSPIIVPGLPSIDDFYITPTPIALGTQIWIGVNASDSLGIDSVWANITKPDGSSENISLVNNQDVSWSPPSTGAYSVELYANNTYSNYSSETSTFHVGNLTEINISIIDIDDYGLSTDLELFVSGTNRSVYQDTDSDGDFLIDLVEHDYDILLPVFSDEFELLLKEVSLTEGFQGNISLDRPPATDGFDQIYAVETDYQMSGARIRIYYEDMGFVNETTLTAYECDSWDFSDQICYNDWDQVSSPINNLSDEYVEFQVSGFSAFALDEEGFCGDGSCDPGETAGDCPDDCLCDNGDTRPCNTARTGRCASGEETCVNNVWVGCPTPIDESCNLEDDDCDGIIDDIDDGRSISATKCQCYGGGSPTIELCNGIDDNCDGLIDNGADCCTVGDTRPCGPTSETGECVKGAITCVDGTWGSDCVGAVFPSKEVCDDGLDNDCDNSIDENCQVPDCGEGEISESCTCEGSPRDSGYCCTGFYSEGECVQNFWWILIVIGVIILILLAVLLLHFRSSKQGPSWDELMKKYSYHPPE